jgi:hypothetical protein
VKVKESRLKLFTVNRSLKKKEDFNMAETDKTQEGAQAPQAAQATQATQAAQEPKSIREVLEVIRAQQAEIEALKAAQEAQSGAVSAPAPAAEEDPALLAARENEKRMREPVTIELFKDNDKYKDDVFVAVNGKSYQIQRGVPVTVPRFVKEALDHSQFQDRAAAKYVAKLVGDYDSGALMAKNV